MAGLPPVPAFAVPKSSSPPPPALTPLVFLLNPRNPCLLSLKYVNEPPLLPPRRTPHSRITYLCKRSGMWWPSYFCFFPSIQPLVDPGIFFSLLCYSRLGWAFPHSTQIFCLSLLDPQTLGGANFLVPPGPFLWTFLYSSLFYFFTIRPSGTLSLAPVFTPPLPSLEPFLTSLLFPFRPFLFSRRSFPVGLIDHLLLFVSCTVAPSPSCRSPSFLLNLSSPCVFRCFPCSFPFFFYLGPNELFCNPVKPLVAIFLRARDSPRSFSLRCLA